MDVITLSTITAANLKDIARVTEKGIADYAWTKVDHIALSDAEYRQIDDIIRRLLHTPTTLMNEATIWARAIYPLLVLAEQGDIRAWAQVPLRAHYPHVELQGVADGVIAMGITNIITTAYYLIVVEAKRGLEAQDPRFQLYGQVLAAARLNWEHDQQPLQEMYGCYTISDDWTFLRAEVHDIDTDRPAMTIELSREYAQKAEAETILQMLKHIVAKHIDTPEEVAHS